MAHILVLLALLFPSSAALAHGEHGGTVGLMHGFLHPLSGLDHVAAMFAIGVFAARLKGRGPWCVPLAFVAMMILGGTLGAARIPLPQAEIFIGLSLVVLGAAVALDLSPPVVAGVGLGGFFAVFHGYAHGAEMPQSDSGLAYGLGFVLATVLLHAVGVTAGTATKAVRWRGGPRLWRIAGSALAMAGCGSLAGWF
jgi:urease accessory protein